MEAIHGKEVLISGASIAGLSAAWWMHQLGYQVTVVERAPQPRTGGSAVDFKGDTIAVVKRMGLYDQLIKYRLHCDLIEFKNEADETQYSVPLPEGVADEIEIERDAFVEVLFTDLQPKVAFLFNNSITALYEAGDGVVAQLANGPVRTFHLVLGCDGVHSTVRKLWFGEEARYAHFMQAYGSITIVNKLLIRQGSAQIYRLPGKSIYLNAYNGKTDIIFNFFSEQAMAFDYRNKAQQRQLVMEQFRDQGWRSAELLEELRQSDDFYFIEYYQIKMPSWTKGRIALIGDAAYCVTPAAGRGGSLAMGGAAILADALQKHQGNYSLAFEEYNQTFRPFIDSVQADAQQTLQTVFLPQTEEAVQQDPLHPKYA
jgi:2-polyprenyl-6-methoxyphenol hydroxylase-like FAD-dependent oxidoreductase